MINAKTISFSKDDKYYALVSPKAPYLVVVRANDLSPSIKYALDTLCEYIDTGLTPTDIRQIIDITKKERIQ